MAEVEDLSPEQTESLIHFQDMTGIEDMQKCRDVLQRHNWQLEAAVQHTFNMREGVPSPYTPSPPRPVRTPPVNADAFYQTRIIATRPQRSLSLWDWGKLVILFPFRLVYITVMDIFKFVYRLFRLDPRQHVIDPEGDVRSFTSKFIDEYGHNCPTLFQGTYGQALNEAKSNLRFLMVYLHNEDHPDTGDFCRNTLLHPNVTNFINRDVLFWACSINKPEGFRVSNALRCNSHPFLALIVLRENKMTVVARVEGPVGPEVLVEKLSRVIENNQMSLAVTRADREERATNRSLREMQDDAYNRSLEADREKERKKQEELDSLQELEEEERRQQLEEEQRLQEIADRKIKLRNEIPPEPSQDDPDALKILLKLPSGSRLERRFIRSQSLKHLYNYVFCHEDAPDNFQIITNFPRKSLPCQPTEDFEPPTFAEVGLGKMEMLFVHDNDA